MKTSIHLLALREAQEASDWYEQRREGLGEVFLNHVAEALRLIEEHPLAWPCWPKDPTVRLKIIKRFPYAIVFRFQAETIRVLAIAHDKRRRGYWAGR